MQYTVSHGLHFESEPVKGSRFIVDIASVSAETEERSLLAKVTKRFPAASHHCWAWRIASPAIERASDDGEPSGSAGRPILAQVAGRDLVDVAVVVTRYFGGTKLGVGGLMRAYGGAAGEALDTMTFEPWVEITEVRFEHDYAFTDAIERAIHVAAGAISARDFAANVDVLVRLPVGAVEEFASNVADLSAGAIVLDVPGCGRNIYPNEPCDPV